jgi:hypothetical protein
MRVGAVAVPLLVLVSIAVLLPNHPAGRDVAEDSGVFFYAAQRLLDGGAPYRDIWDHKPPGVYFVDAIGIVIGGQTGVWLVQLASLIAAALVSYRALSREFGVAAGLAGSLAWLVALPRLFLSDAAQTSFVEFYALPLQFGALLLFGPPLTRSRALGIGALGGAALLLKPTLVGVVLAIGLVTLVRSKRAAVTPLVLIALGALVPLAIVALWAAGRGVLGEMLDQAVVYNRAYAGFAPLSDRIDAVLSGLRLTLPSGLAVVAVVAWLYAIASRRFSPMLVAVALVALPLEIVLSTWGRGYHYYFIPWLPAMAVLTAFAASELQRLVPSRIARPALALGGAADVCSARASRLASRADDRRRKDPVRRRIPSGEHALAGHRVDLGFARGGALPRGAAVADAVCLSVRGALNARLRDACARGRVAVRPAARSARSHRRCIARQLRHTTAGSCRPARVGLARAPVRAAARA